MPAPVAYIRISEHGARFYDAAMEAGMHEEKQWAGDDFVLWFVDKTTTEKLEETLQAIDATSIDSEVHQIQYLGGRDWVVVYQAQREA